MAQLTTCKDCKAQISKNATTCPHCGAKQKKMSIFKWLLIIFFGLPLLVGIASGLGNKDKAQEVADTTTEEGTLSNKEEASAVATDNGSSEANASVEDNWQYSDFKDEMRGTVTNVAVNTSETVADFDFPYNGGSQLQIVIRDNEGSKDVMFVITKGQFDCGITDCEISAKFDDGPVESLSAARAEGGVSDTIFLANGEAAFIKKLKNSKQVIIEPKFFQHGAEQFKFKTAGLK